MPFKIECSIEYIWVDDDGNPVDPEQRERLFKEIEERRARGEDLDLDDLLHKTK